MVLGLRLRVWSRVLFFWVGGGGGGVAGVGGGGCRVRVFG